LSDGDTAEIAEQFVRRMAAIKLSETLSGLINKRIIRLRRRIMRLQIQFGTVLVMRLRLTGGIRLRRC